MANTGIVYQPSPRTFRLGGIARRTRAWARARYSPSTRREQRTRQTTCWPSGPPRQFRQPDRPTPIANRTPRDRSGPTVPGAPDGCRMRLGGCDGRQTHQIGGLREESLLSHFGHRGAVRQNVRRTHLPLSPAHSTRNHAAACTSTSGAAKQHADECQRRVVHLRSDGPRYGAKPGSPPTNCQPRRSNRRDSVARLITQDGCEHRNLLRCRQGQSLQFRYQTSAKPRWLSRRRGERCELRSCRVLRLRESKSVPAEHPGRSQLSTPRPPSGARKTLEIAASQTTSQARVFNSPGRHAPSHGHAKDGCVAIRTLSTIDVPVPAAHPSGTYFSKWGTWRHEIDIDF